MSTTTTTATKSPSDTMFSDAGIAAAPSPPAPGPIIDPPATTAATPEQSAEAREALNKALAKDIKAKVAYKDGEFVADSIEGVYRIAEMFYTAGLYTHLTNNLPKATAISRLAVVISNGRQMGIGAHPSCNNTYIMNSKLCMYGDILVAVVRGAKKADGSPKFREIKCVFDKSTDVATCTLERLHDGGHIELIKAEFGPDQAKAAGLDGNTMHKKYPERMRMSRARAYALRDGASDVLCGVADREEMEDVAWAESQSESARIEQKTNELPTK